MRNVGELTTNIFGQVRHPNAGRRLWREFLEMFPADQLAVPSISAADLRAAAANGATIRWAVRASGLTVGKAAYLKACTVRYALVIASEVPVKVIDVLLGYGWTLPDLYTLMTWDQASLLPKMMPKDFSKTIRRIRALHETVPRIGGPAGGLLWHAPGAIRCAAEAHLTDLQTFRWLQALDPVGPVRSRKFDPVWLDPSHTGPRVREWAAAAGPNGWAWAAAGYTPDEARVLRALPETHPDRPGPDQLVVMAALRQT